MDLLGDDKVTPMPVVAMPAYGKLNLALALRAPESAGSARPGWHRICTWMCAIDLADRVLIEPLGRAEASTWSAAWAADSPRPGAIDWMPEKDLAWRALRAVERRLGRSLPTRIVLEKRIPTGAGLGGGSADGAAALAAIDRAWELGLGPEVLRALGAGLGSDVAFFIDEEQPARPAVVSGFGEQVERTARVAGEVVLFVPPFGCPTGAVYRAFDEVVAGAPRPHTGRDSVVREMARGARALDAELFNDLAEPAMRVRPELAAVRAGLGRALGRPVHVTGSGSSLFVLCGPGEGERVAAGARQALDSGSGRAAVRVCRLV
ncbi:MAG TPA: hypothetical protein VFF69_10785 [Phycisphaerales bacterium]|nr:hypothetical protein [Phycisphaerales bacterium]